MNPKSNGGNKEINLKRYYNIIKKRFWIVMVTTFLTTFLAVMYVNHFTSPLYQSSSRIILGADQDEIKTLKVILKDPAILSKVIDKLGIEKSPNALAGEITVSNVDDSQVINITVVDANSKLAEKIANTTAEVFKEEIGNIVNFNKVSILSKATENPWPINSDHTKSIASAFIAGIVLGIGVIFFLNSLDNTLRTEKEIEEILGVPVLGSISRMKKNNTLKKVVTKESLELRGESIGS